MAKRGRPRLTANTKLIETLASKGCTKREIAQIIGCGDTAFEANFRAFYDKGRQTLVKKLREKQIDVALKGNVAMLIWLGKQYLDQTEKQVLEFKEMARVIGQDPAKVFEEAAKRARKQKADAASN